ncbi:ferredoxin reductase [Nocardia sp. NBC_01329]|uniref:ferredoxin reductase n=1 Tax=Nocardia sp. NBC_01329 TaxID=2903594 RepID=UPI002E105193|nr:ferredoxin reductase [Nocardia sp. NBC_01329]
MIGTAVDVCRSIFVARRPASLLPRSKPLWNSGFNQRLLVAAIQREAVDVVGVVLVDPEGGSLPAWLPGAHLDVFLPSGRRRQYSLCGDPRDRSSYRIAVRLMPHGDGGSIEIHENLCSGDSLRVHGPRHTYPFLDASDYLFIAGGMGITAILPMAQAAGRRGTLIYTGRSRDSMPFLDRVPGAVIRPDDEFGAPDIEELLARADPGTAVYVCGPPAMLEAAIHAVPRVAPASSLHLERFPAARAARARTRFEPDRDHPKTGLDTGSS